jgi:hypothetical protein
MFFKQVFSLHTFFTQRWQRNRIGMAQKVVLLEFCSKFLQHAFTHGSNTISLAVGHSDL